MATAKRDPHRPSRKTELLQAALDEFSSGDIAEITMPKIAARANMTTAAVYYHFKTKDLLLEALLAQTNISLVQIVAPAEPGMDPVAWVHDTVDRFGKWLRDHPQEARFSFISASAPNPSVRQMRLKAHNRVVGTFADRLTIMDPEYFDHVRAWFTGGALLVMFAEIIRSQMKDSTVPPRSLNNYVKGAKLVAERIVSQEVGTQASPSKKTVKKTAK